jgi:hypothetical protein
MATDHDPPRGPPRCCYGEGRPTIHPVHGKGSIMQREDRKGRTQKGSRQKRGAVAPAEQTTAARAGLSPEQWRAMLAGVEKAGQGLEKAQHGLNEARDILDEAIAHYGRAQDMGSRAGH